MFRVLKPFVGPACLLAIEWAANMTGWSSGFLLGFAGFWLLLALLSNRAFMKRFPWILEWAPFLDPSGSFATPEQLTGKHIAGHTFNISAVVNNNEIRERTFEDCDIYGPGVILMMGIGSMSHCSFDAPTASILIVTPQRNVVGPIGAFDCTFRRCRFHGIGLIGPEEAIERWKNGITQVNSDVHGKVLKS